jgi:hypothetical protein
LAYTLYTQLDQLLGLVKISTRDEDCGADCVGGADSALFFARFACGSVSFCEFI